MGDASHDSVAGYQNGTETSNNDTEDCAQESTSIVHNAGDNKETCSMNSFDQMPLLAKIKLVLFTLRTEYMLLFHMFWNMASELIVQNLLLYKACKVNLNYSEETCNELLSEHRSHNMSQVETDVQKVVSEIGVWKSAVENTIPIAFVLFMGSWSDRHGRKVCILLPLLGFLLKFVALALSSKMESWDAQTMVLAAYIPVSLTGSQTALNMALNSYVIDFTSLSRRTLRQGVLNVCLPIGISLGNALGGTIYRSVGFFWLFTMAAIAESISIAYTFIFIHDLDQTKPTSPKNICLDVFDIQNVSDIMKTLVKRREDKKRLKLNLLFVVAFLAFWPGIGESSVLYLFTRKRLGWNEIDFGLFTTFSLVIMMAGCFISLFLMSHKLKMKDTSLGAIAFISEILSNIMLNFVSTDWMMYSAPVIGILNGATVFICRTIPTKMVTNEEIGRVNAFIGVLDSLTPVMATPVYSGLYRLTLDSFSGAIFLLSSGISTIPLSIYIWLYIDSKREELLVT